MKGPGRAPAEALDPGLKRRLRAAAERDGLGVDRDVYAQAGRDPMEPILLGSGSLDASLGVLGRDPGRTEVLLGEPFIGKGGQLVRHGLHRAVHGRDAPDTDAMLEVGRRVFWCNTVPYKPVGNKAWPVAVKRRFVEPLAELMVQHWTGHDLLTCGNVAFDWFRLAQPDLKHRLRAFWARPDRYEASLEVVLRGKRLRLHPLPHPSPLNATWYPRFPALLDARLRAIGWTG